MATNKDIPPFLKRDLLCVLPPNYRQFKKQFCFTEYGHFMECLSLVVSRADFIRVYPTYYVLGADLSDHGIPNTVSLFVEQPRQWSFKPDTALNREFAEEIVKRLKENADISFFDPLSDEVIDKGLRQISRDFQHWSADLFLAFFNIVRGAPSAREDLAKAFKLFHKYSRLSTNKPLYDFEEKLRDRFVELEARLDRPDCIALCRADAEAHAKALELPAIVWPEDWPVSVPPWPKRDDSKWGHRIKELFGH